MNLSPKRKLLYTFSFLLWMLIVLVIYYWGHKPLAVANFIGIFNSMWDILLVVLVSVLAGGIGCRIIPAKKLAALERVVLQVSLGFGILGLFWFLLGLFSLYIDWVAWIFLFAGLVIFRRFSWQWIKDFLVLREIWSHSGRLEKSLILIAILLVLGQLLFALSPPTKYDALTYHLELPRHYVADGRFSYISTNPYWGHPQLTEVLYTWMMLLARPQTAATLCWGFGFFTLLGVMGVASSRLVTSNQSEYAYAAKSEIGVTAGCVAVVSLLAGYTFRYLMGWSYTELFTTMLGVSILIVLFEGLKTKKDYWVYWAGIFTGFAVGTKWTAGVIAVGIYLSLVLLKKRTGFSLRAIIISVFLAVVSMLPWLLKNLFWTGNPLYPYLFSTSMVVTERLTAASAGPGFKNIWSIVSLPFTITWLGFDSAPGFGTDLGPFLLLFVAIGLYVHRHKTSTLVIFSSFIAGWLFMGLGSILFSHLRQTRIYFVLIPAGAIVSGWGWAYIQSFVVRGVRLRRIIGGVSLLLMLLVLGQDVVKQAQLSPGGVVLGVQNQDAFLDISLGWYTPTMEALHELPDESKVLMLWEGRGLYAPLTAHPDHWIDHWRVAYWEHGEPDAITHSWLADGFTHVLVNKVGADFMRAEPDPLETDGWIAFDELQATLPEPISFGDIYFLYALPQH
jgi:hypothetical protein